MRRRWCHHQLAIRSASCPRAPRPAPASPRCRRPPERRRAGHGRRRRPEPRANRLPRRPDRARVGIGMPSGVGHCLDRDPVRRGLDRRRQLAELVTRGDRDPWAIDAVGVLSERAGQAELVQCRRSQVVREPPDVGDQALRAVPHRDQRGRCTRRIGLDQSSGRLRTQAESGNGRAYLVMGARRSRRRSSSRASTSRSRER